MIGRQIMATIKGMTVEEAEKHCKESNIRLRVVKKDGVDLGVTMDYRTDRINVEIKDGKVVGGGGLG